MSEHDTGDDKDDEPAFDWRLEVSRKFNAELDALAARAAPITKAYTRNYLDGASIVSHIRGGPYSPETLRKSAIPRIYIGREARLNDEDLIALGEALREADLKTLHQGPRPTRQKNRRRRESADLAMQDE